MEKMQFVFFVPPKMKVKGYMYPQMKKPVGMLGKVCLIQHYVIKIVSDWQQVVGFLWVFWFPSSINLATMK
jgi:hypothetical protein